MHPMAEAAQKEREVLRLRCAPAKDAGEQGARNSAQDDSACLRETDGAQIRPSMFAEHDVLRPYECEGASAPTSKRGPSTARPGASRKNKGTGRAAPFLRQGRQDDGACLREADEVSSWRNSGRA